MHPNRVTVWCGFWSGRVIGPYFFQDDNGNAMTMNEKCYQDVVMNFSWLALHDIDTVRM